MKALVLRDIELRKPMIAFWGAYSLFFFLPALIFVDWRPDLAFALVLVSILIGSLWIISGSKAETSSPDLLIASFPIRRRDLADVKFLEMLGAAAYGCVTTLAWGFALRALGLPIEIEGLNGLVPLRIAAGLGLVSWLVPLHLRFGADFARIFMVAALALAVVLQIGLVVLLGARASAATAAFHELRAAYLAIPILARNLALFGVGLFVGVLSWLATRRIAARKEY